MECKGVAGFLPMLDYSASLVLDVAPSVRARRTQARPSQTRANELGATQGHVLRLFLQGQSSLSPFHSHLRTRVAAAFSRSVTIPAVLSFYRRDDVFGSVGDATWKQGYRWIHLRYFIEIHSFQSRHFLRAPFPPQFKERLRLKSSFLS